MHQPHPSQTDRRTYRFTALFISITVLEMLGDELAVRWLHYGFKPLIMGSLMVYSQLGTSRRPSAWMGVGMVFALLGDVLLMIREVDLFAVGLGAFLLMQLSYSAAFWQSIRRQTTRLIHLRWQQALLFAGYLVAFLGMLYPAFLGTPALKPLWWPVVVYAICLCTMGFLASQRGPKAGASWVTIGALLFILSDSAIAIDKFLMPIPGATVLIMSAYAAAQYLIVLGMLR
ncbi:lysoplasmalogenase [Fibrella aestuarina]|nr:lysoplasmalogenase [Fibrella aestuarina]